jgi:hypothetical protein
VALLAMSLAIVVPVFAGSLIAGPLVQVSGSSPFATCTADNVGGQSGTNYLNSEVEPWIDVNPDNPDNIVGIWQQDRWSNGGSRGLVAGVSLDGGATWATVPIPGISSCTGGDYQRASDPWVSFGPTGTLYQLSLSFNDYDFAHALLASRSTDGGVTWSAPVAVKTDTAAAVFNDKQSITADPLDPSLVYAVWDRLEYPNENANVKAAFHALGYRSSTWFARSTDGGLTWEPARQILDPGGPNQIIGNQIVVLPNGDLVNVFDLVYNTKNAHKVRGLNVAIIRSTDKGATWSEPIIVAKLQTVYITDPETGAYIRTEDILPEIAVDPGSGQLYVVWQDARFSGFQNDSIALSASTDGGFTWSAPIKVNQTPTNLPAGDQQAFTPSVSVASDGTVGVTYYDFRNNTPDATLLTDYLAVHCHGGCANAANWGDELQLTVTSFNMNQAPYAGGRFVGDYAGLAVSGNDFMALFSQSHDSDPASVFFREFGP